MDQVVCSVSGVLVHAKEFKSKKGKTMHVLSVLQEEVGEVVKVMAFENGYSKGEQIENLPVRISIGPKGDLTVFVIDR